MSMSPKIVDLFCGVGGFSLGFEMAGFETVLAIDHWNDAIDTYNFNRKNKMGVSLDIERFDNEYINGLISEHGQIDGVIGGPPCQGFSTVGTRDINDPRNHLYLEYCRIVEKIRPKFFIIENVKGLLTLNNGAFKDDIVSRFTSLGYKVFNPTVLDAADFGVPQHRKRIFFVGLLDGEFEFPSIKTEKVSTFDALSDLPSLDDSIEVQNEFEYLTPPQNNYQKFIRTNSVKILNHNKTNHTTETVQVISMIKDGGRISDLPSEYWNIRKYNKSFQRMNSSLPSHTIDTGHRNYFHYSENRVPSVRECARLQSFPDNFVFTGSKTSQYKQVGNAVPPLLAYEIALKLNEVLLK